MLAKYPHVITANYRHSDTNNIIIPRAAKNFGFWFGHVLEHSNLPHDTIEGKMLGKATRGRRRVELLHDMMKGRDYGQLKNLISESDRSRWRQDSK